MFREDPIESADGSLDERAGGDFTFQTLLVDFIRNPDPHSYNPAEDDDIPVAGDDEEDMVMMDNTLCDVYGEALGWYGVRALQRLRSRLRTMDPHATEQDINSIIEAIGDASFTDEELMIGR